MQPRVFLKRLFKKIKPLMRVLEVFSALTFVSVSLSFWQLSRQPVNVDFLLPELSRHILPEKSGLKMSVGSIYLKTGIQKEGLLHIDISDLSVFRSDGSVLLKTPQISLSYSLWNVITLNYFPDNLTIDKLVLSAIVDKEGNFYLQNNLMTQENNTSSMPTIPETPMILSTDVNVALTTAQGLAAVTQEQETVQEKKTLQKIRNSDMEAIVKYFLKFKNVEINNAAFFLEDQKFQKKLRVSKINILLSWPHENEHELSVTGVVSARRKEMPFTIGLLLDKRQKQIAFDVGFESVHLSHFSSFFPFLKSDKLVLKGKTNGLFDFSKSTDKIRKSLKEFAFQIETQQPGSLNLPAPLTNEYHIQTALINGQFDPEKQILQINESHITLQEGPEAEVDVVVTGIDRWLDTQDFSHVQTKLKANVQKVSVDQVPSVWPNALGPDAHAWVKQNLTGGQVTDANFTLYFKGAELADLFGRLFVKNTKVSYLGKLPPVETVSGEVLLYPDKVEIFANTGRVKSLQLQKADLYFTDLLSDVSQAKIELTVTGPVSEALEVISFKPLEFPQMFGIKPSETGGFGTVQTTLQFPLTEGLQMQDVTVDVDAHLTDAVFPTPISGVSLENGEFDLKVTNQKLNLDGFAAWQGQRLGLTWQENFQNKGKSGVQSSYQVKGTLSFDQINSVFPELSPYVSGKASVDAVIKKHFSGQSFVEATVDLTNSRLDIYLIGMSKKKNIKATFKTKGDFDDKKTKMAFSFDAPQLPVFISGDFEKKDGYRVVLHKLASPKTNFSGVFHYRPQEKLDVQLSGKNWDLTHLNKMFSGKETQQEYKPLPILQTDIQLNEVVFVEKKPLKNVIVQLERQGAFWKKLFVSAQAANPFEARFNGKNKTLTAACENVGDFLERISVTPRFSGGRFSLEAKQQVQGGFEGDINIKKFQFKDPGFFIQAVTILGIVNAFTEDELSFKKAHIPFKITPDLKLQIKDGYANGTTLGITFKGTVSPSSVALSGSVLPAYVINSLLGRIPLIGHLFKDGEGGGLMGVRYDVSGPVFSPKVTFNPLASMAPGFLGGLF